MSVQPQTNYRLALLLSHLRALTHPDAHPAWPRSTLPVSETIVNVNLIRLKRHSGGDVEAALSGLRDYFVSLMSIVAAQGGTLRFIGLAPTIRGGNAAASHNLREFGTAAAVANPWDVVALVEYPSLRHYRAVIESEAFLAIRPQRRNAVDKSVLFASRAVDSQGSAAKWDAISQLRFGAHCRFALSAAASEGIRDEVTLFKGVGVSMLVGEAGHASFNHFTLSHDGGVKSTESQGDAVSTALPLRSIPVKSLSTLSVSDLKELLEGA
jgi:hypothetical protein